MQTSSHQNLLSSNGCQRLVWNGLGGPQSSGPMTSSLVVPRWNGPQRELPSYSRRKSLHWGEAYRQGKAEGCEVKRRSFCAERTSVSMDFPQSMHYLTFSRGKKKAKINESWGWWMQQNVFVFCAEKHHGNISCCYCHLDGITFLELCKSKCKCFIFTDRKYY